MQKFQQTLQPNVYVRHLAFVGLVLLSLFTACRKDDDNQVKPTPAITAIVPDSAFVGDTVTITGANFSAEPIANIITFNNGVEAFGILSASPTELRVTVPAGAATGPVTVKVNGQTSDGVNFRVRIATPLTITAISPTEGYFGDTLTITGTGFKPDDFLKTNADGSRNAGVSIGGTGTVTIAATPTQLRVVVPVNTSTGVVSVRVGTSTIEGPQFTVVPPAPQIASFEPARGAEGTPVTIRGTNFLRDVRVTLNGVTVPMVNTSETQLQVIIPPNIAPGEYPFVVTAQGKEVTSATKFVVTPPPLADRYLYFVQGSDIYRASISEQDGQLEVASTPLFTGGAPQDLVVDAKNNKLYWADQANSAVMEGNLDGSGTPKVLFGPDQVGSSQSPVGLTLANGKLYWTEGNANLIVSGNVNGTGYQVLYGDKPEDGVTFSQDVEIEVVGNKLYWTEVSEQQVVRGNIDGSGTPEVIFDSNDGLLVPLGLQIDAASGKIYVADSPVAWGAGQTDRILVGNLNGSGRLTALFDTGDGVINPNGIALDVAGGKIYWMNQDPNTAIASVARGSLNGNGAPEIIINNLPNFGAGLAVQVEE